MYPYNLSNDIFNMTSLDARKNDYENDDYNNEEKYDNSMEDDDYLDINEYILDLINMAIEEKHASSKYFEELIKMISNPEDEKILRKIYLDELKNTKIFEEIYYQLTGEKSEPDFESIEVEGDLAQNYAKSILNKLENVEFYRRILFSFLNVPIRDWLYEVITDEQSDAQRLQYLYTNLLNQK